MPDDGTHASVVHRVICVRIEKRRLHDSSRKDDLVHRRVVVRIDRRRRHSPLGAIDWLTDSGQVPMALVLAHSDLIVEERSRLDGERGVITPLVGITDLVGKGCQLCHSLRFRSVAHPAEGPKSIVKDGLQVANHLERPLFCLGTEVFGDVRLAECVSQPSVCGPGAALLARQHFLRTAQCAGEAEIFIHERRAEAPSCAVDDFPAEVRLPIVERGGRQ